MFLPQLGTLSITVSCPECRSCDLKFYLFVYRESKRTSLTADLPSCFIITGSRLTWLWTLRQLLYSENQRNDECTFEPG